MQISLPCERPKNLVDPGTDNNQSCPFLVDAKEAGRLLALSRSQFLSLDKCGRLGPQSINLGYGAKRQCRRWNVRELQRWIDAGCPNRQEWHQRTGLKEAIYA